MFLICDNRFLSILNLTSRETTLVVVRQFCKELHQKMTALSAPTYSHLDALVTFMTGFVLPSGDIYSDIALSVKLLNNSCDEYEPVKSYNRSTGTWYLKDPCNHTWTVTQVEIKNLFGWIIWIPIIFNFLFTIPHFLRVEKTWKQRLLTFPLLICQCWPQYRSLRVIWFAYVPKNFAKCLAEKLDLEQNVSNLGKKLSIHCAV